MTPPGGSSSDTPALRRNLRRAVAGLLLLGGLVLAVLSALWFLTDFIQLSLSSPNLDPQTQVADFDDFAYIADSLHRHRLGLGLVAALVAIAVVAQAAALLSPAASARQRYIVGGIALALETALLVLTYYWPFFLPFLLTAAGLWLTAELTATAAEPSTDNADGTPAASTGEDTPAGGEGLQDPPRYG